MIIVDTSWLMYKSFFSHYGHEPVHTNKLKPVHVHYILDFYEKIRKTTDEKVVFALDSHPSWRAACLPGYKANRQKTRQLDLHKDTKALAAMLHAGGAYTIREDGLEADDLIFSIVCKNHKKCKRIKIITGDSDLYQCLKFQDVFVIKSSNPFGKWFGNREFVAKYGFESSRFYLFKAIEGKVNDGIKGVMDFSQKEFSREMTRDLCRQGIDENSLESYMPTKPQYEPLKEELIRKKEKLLRNTSLLKLRVTEPIMDNGYTAREVTTLMNKYNTVQYQRFLKERKAV